MNITNETKIKYIAANLNSFKTIITKKKIKIK